MGSPTLQVESEGGTESATALSDQPIGPQPDEPTAEASLEFTTPKDWLKNCLSAFREAQNAGWAEFENTVERQGFKFYKGGSSRMPDTAQDTLLKAWTEERDALKRESEEHKREIAVLNGRLSTLNDRLFPREKSYEEKLKAQKVLVEGLQDQLEAKEEQLRLARNKRALELADMQKKVWDLESQVNRQKRWDEITERELKKSETETKLCIQQLRKERDQRMPEISSVQPLKKSFLAGLKAFQSISDEHISQIVSLTSDLTAERKQTKELKAKLETERENKKDLERQLKKERNTRDELEKKLKTVQRNGGIHTFKTVGEQARVVSRFINELSEATETKRRIIRELEQKGRDVFGKMRKILGRETIPSPFTVPSSDPARVWLIVPVRIQVYKYHDGTMLEHFMSWQKDTEADLMEWYPNYSSFEAGDRPFEGCECHGHGTADFFKSDPVEDESDDISDDGSTHNDSRSRALLARYEAPKTTPPPTNTGEDATAGLSKKSKPTKKNRDDDSYTPRTGAEHAGRRSRSGLKFCPFGSGKP
ncbi:hypothetical protein M011DRAFT_153915 [Sporormia fimetaria CBS 119925]|uniref:Uncharacterized protein n=1 Tax=Sporormia fimetaria CBS 119925 TaxID=1340428 RepID=A0A6A6V4Y9_9PLEO|nr:hypothetical protein M011DRAFT_153915 [Sporormia fimetaria CBS 119925]